MKNDSEHVTVTIPRKIVEPIRAARSAIEKFMGQGIVSTIMILFGLVVLAYFVSQGITDYKKYNSPFDEVDHALGSQSGLLPIIEVDGESLLAPTIENDATQAYLDSIGPLRDMTAGELLFNKIGLETLNNPVTIGLIPDRLIIPKLDIFVDINPVGYWEINFEGSIYKQWDTVDEYATGWHNSSARIGTPGNTVISGHHNVFGKVFQNLYTMQKGDVIQVKTAGNKLVTYRVARVLVLEEKYQPIDVRLQNAQWIQSSTDERLTLVTCWPNDDNSHRVVVVALPIES